MKSILLILFAINCFAQAPIIQWQKTLGGSRRDYGFKIKATPDGGYVAVSQSSSIDGDVNEGTISELSKGWVVKMNSSGAIEWKKSLGGSQVDYAYDIDCTADGGYIVACGTNSNDGQVTFNHGDFDVLIVKLNALGTIVWSQTYGCSTYDGVSSIKQTADGGYVFSANSSANNGDVTNNHGFNDVWIVKLSASGIIQWQKSFGGTGYDIPNDIELTTDGGYIVCGETTSTNFDVTTNNGSWDYWVLKLNSLGNIIWQKTYGGNLYENAYSIIQTIDGGYIVAGQTGSNNGDVTGNHGGLDCWIIKLNATGTVVWQKTFGGLGNDSPIDMIQANDGGYVICGGTSSTDNTFSNNHGMADFYIFKIDTTGNLIWQKILGGTNDDYAEGGLHMTPDGGYIIIGTTFSNNGDVLLGLGDGDIWIVKLSPELSLETFQQSSITTYPNPTKSQITIKIPDTITIKKIIITDLNGKTILEQNGNSNQVNVQNLKNGIYFIQVLSENNMYKTKFIKE